MSDWTRAPRLLAGVRVLALGQGPARLCARTLEALGAAVELPVSPGRTRLSATDVVVADDLPERLGLPSWERVREEHPRLVAASITPFGLDGPRRGWLGCDLTAAAAGGQLHVTGEPHRAPLPLFGAQAFHLGALNAAAGVVLALLRRQASGQGALVDVSLQEAVASGLDHVLVRYFATGVVPGRTGDRHWNDSSLVVPCADGPLLVFPFLRWETLVEWMAADGAAGDLSDPRYREPDFRAARFDAIRGAISRWTAGRARTELFETAQLMGLPWAPVCTPAEAEASPQHEARGYDARQGGLPCLFSAGVPSAPPAACGGALPLSGVRVLDFTRVLAGPYATRLLADFGAEVIKVQTRRTVGGAESDDEPYFAMWNRNKRSVTVDLDRPGGRDAVLALAERCNVVAENFSPRVLDNWRLGWESLRQVNPGLVLLRMSAAGQTGPWRDLVAYGPTIHALSGLTHLTAYEGGPPVGPGFAHSDVVAGLYGALSVAACLYDRRSTGRGWAVDLSEYEALAGLVLPQAGQAPEPEHAAPRRCLRCAGDDRWCAVAVFDGAQWRALCEELGAGESWEALRDRAAGREAGELAEALQRRGVPAAAGEDARDLAEDPHLAERRFFVGMEHPHLGRVTADRGGLRIQGCEPPLRAAPLLGEANDAVFGGLLGWSAEKIAELRARGVLA